MKTTNGAKLANNIIQWLLEQNSAMNHLFKTNKDFSNFIADDICEETIQELVKLFKDVSLINEVIDSLQTKHTSNETSENKFIGYKIGNTVITLEYSLTNHQSYTKHEAIAKRKLQSILKASGLNITELYFKHIVRHGNTNKYVFTYN